MWHRECPDEFYGHSYKAMDPTTTTWAEQQLGLVMSRAISNQILRAHKRVKVKPNKAGSIPKLGEFSPPGWGSLPSHRSHHYFENTGGNVELLTTLSNSSAVPSI